MQEDWFAESLVTLSTCLAEIFKRVLKVLTKPFSFSHSSYPTVKKFSHPLRYFICFNILTLLPGLYSHSHKYKNDSQDNRTE